MSTIIVIGDKVAEQYGDRLMQLSQRKARAVLSNALNRGGNMARTQIKRSLVAQTGIRAGLVEQAVKTIPSFPSTLAYTLAASGNETNLNLFGAHQGKKGVSAAPWKKRRVFKSTFIVGKFGGRVFKRLQHGHGPIKPLYGPNIARELMKSPTVEKWALAEQFVMARVAHELARVLP
jgi:hypothetical protein